MTWPVFITTGSPAPDDLRGIVAAAVVLYWLRHREAGPVVVLDAGAPEVTWSTLRGLGYLAGRDFHVVHLPIDDSQRQRHVVAHQLAVTFKADYYAATDDDIVPRPEFSLATAFALMDLDPSFALVCALLRSCDVPHVVAGTVPGQESQPIAECGAAGGLRLWRSDVALSRPPPDPSAPRSYDRPLCQAVRDVGRKVGYFTTASPRSLRVAHFPGAAYSTVWPDLAVPHVFPRDGHAENG